MKILIIEDDKNIIDFLTTSFQIAWPEAKLFTTDKGLRGIELVEDQAPDIVLLDLGLPDINGFKVLRQIRLISNVPIIIITVSGEEGSVVKGFTLGANDYISKPLRPLELIARMKSCISKYNYNKEDISLTFGDLHYGQSLHELYRGNKRINLTEIESRIFYILIRNSGRIVTYSQIASEVFGMSYPEVKDSLKTHINHLRQKIEDDPNNPQIILNRRSIGYQLIQRSNHI